MDQLIAEDGEVIPVSVLGTGRPVVVLHGWTGSHREWMYVARQIAPRAQMFCWNARGHGLGPSPVAKPVTLARLADDLHLLLHHYDLQAPLLVGHSMGALTIWQYLLQHGGSGLGGLCLIDQSPCPITDMHWQNGLYGDFDEAAAESFSRELTRDFAGSVLRFLGYDHEGSVAGDAELEAESMALLSEYLGALDATALTTCWESLIRADFRDLLPSIDLPTLLVSGNRSRFYGPKVAHYLHQQIQDSVLKIYREADHSPQLTCPDLLVRDLLAFLDALGGDPVR